MQMFTFNGLAVVAAVIVCVCDVPSITGQSVGLQTVRHGPAPYTVHYAIGQSTAQIGRSYFATCTVIFEAGPYIRLVNTRNNLIVGERGPFNNTVDLGSSVASWDITTYPVLTADHAGVYRCFTATQNSSDTYELILVAAPTITSPLVTAPAQVLYDSDGTISCTGSGVLPITVNWTTQMTLPGAMFPTSMSSVTTAQGGQLRNSTLTFTGNLTVARPLPKNFSATCYVQLVDNFTCSKAMTPSIEADCNVVRTTVASDTTTVTVVRECASLNSTEFIRPAAHSTLPDAVESISCDPGFTPSAATYTCRPSGLWFPAPMCSDIDECRRPRENCTDANANCTNIGGSFLCGCNIGYNGTGEMMGDCEPVRCAVLNGSTIVGVPESNFSTTYNVACRTGFYNATQSSVTCQADMTWSAEPTCSSIDCPMVTRRTFVIPPGSFGKLVRVQCDGELEAEPEFVTCQPDGSYSATPTCSRTADTGSSFAAGAIVGIVIGALAVVVITVIVIYFVCKKNKGDSDSNSGKSGPAIYSETTPNSKPKTKPKTSDVSDPDSASVPLVPVKTADSKLLSQSGTNVRVNTTASNGDPPAETMYAEAGAPTRMSSSGGGVTGIDVGPVDSSTAPTNGQEENHYDTTATANKVWRGENGPPVPVPKTAIDIEMEGAYDTMAQFQHQV